MLQGMTNFVWFCRQADEQFLTNADGSLYNATSSIPYSDAQLDSGILNTTSLGGCFRQGPGLIGITGQGTLTFTARNMRVNDSYVFHVIVFKGDRRDTAETRLKIVDGSPLAVDIGFVNRLTFILLVKFLTLLSFLQRDAVPARHMLSSCLSVRPYKPALYKNG